MRNLGLLVVIGCTPSPAEKLPMPIRTGSRCQSATIVADRRAEVDASNRRRLDEALATYATTHQLTVSTTRLPELIAHQPSVPEIPNIDSARELIRAAHRRQPELVVDLGRTAWSQVVVDFDYIDIARDKCGPEPTATYHLAYDASGAPEVVAVHAIHRVTSLLDQCGSCTIGCGIPWRPLDWIGWALPIPTGVHVPIDSVDVAVDDLDIRCEHETLAQ